MSDILPKQSGKTSPLNAIRTNYLANINMTRIGHHAERLLFQSCLGRSKLFGKKCIRPVRPHQNQKIRSIWKNKTVQINLGVFGEFKDILKTHTITAAKPGKRYWLPNRKQPDNLFCNIKGRLNIQTAFIHLKP